MCCKTFFQTVRYYNFGDLRVVFPVTVLVKNLLIFYSH